MALRSIRPFDGGRLSCPNDRAKKIADEFDSLVDELVARGVTITRICVELNVSAPTLWRYRKNRAEPLASTVDALRELAAGDRKATGT